MDYHVLLVSGYPAILIGERKVLEDLGGMPSDRIIEAQTLEEAIQQIEANGSTIGVIVTELRLKSSGSAAATAVANPGGLELLKYVTEKVPMISVIVTSSGDPDYYGHVIKQRGAYDFFYKGGPIQELVDKVNGALSKRSKQPDLK